MTDYGDELEEFYEAEAVREREAEEAYARELPRRERPDNEAEGNGWTDLAESLHPEPKRLPYGGRWYEFPADVPAEVWLTMQTARREHAAAEAARAAGREPRPSRITDAQGDAMQDALLGRADDPTSGLARMIADGVTGSVIDHAQVTLTVWHMGDEASAQAVWSSFGKGATEKKAAPRNRAERRAMNRE